MIRRSGSSRTELRYGQGLLSPFGTHLKKKVKTNLSHDGLNPAHVQRQWMNNPTLCPCCEAMILRADIEESKSNVAMYAWLPQASYPCGNFSGTSSLKFRAKFPLPDQLTLKRFGFTLAALCKLSREALLLGSTHNHRSV